MTPAEVDAGLVEKGMTVLGMWAKGPARDAQERDVRAVLAAVLPEYGITLLSEVMQAIRHEAQKHELDSEWERVWNLATGHAVSVVAEQAARLHEGSQS